MKYKKLYEANTWWNDWKFQLHWHKIEWVDPRCQIKKKNLFSFFKTIFINKFKTFNSEITEEANIDEAITSESKSCNKMEIDLQKVLHE